MECQEKKNTDSYWLREIRKLAQKLDRTATRNFNYLVICWKSQFDESRAFDELLRIKGKSQRREQSHT